MIAGMHADSAQELAGYLLVEFLVVNKNLLSESLQHALKREPVSEAPSTRA
jgi:hypothetical protein